MAIAITLKKYLEAQGAQYQVVEHPRTQSSSQTAQASHVPGDQLAKAVVVKSNDGYLLAVLPASCHIQMDLLQNCLDRPVGLAREEEIGELFGDCQLGAVPPLGPAYGLEVIVEDRFAEQSDIYFEGGDHTSLIQVSGQQFRELMASPHYGCFSLHD